MQLIPSTEVTFSRETSSMRCTLLLLPRRAETVCSFLNVFHQLLRHGPGHRSLEKLADDSSYVISSSSHLRFDCPLYTLNPTDPQQFEPLPHEHEIATSIRSPSCSPRVPHPRQKPFAWRTYCLDGSKCYSRNCCTYPPE